MTVLVLQPNPANSADTFIYSALPTLNYGIKTQILIGLHDGGEVNRALIKFDLSSLSPASVITSAILSLYCNIENNTTDRAVTTHRSITQWFEGSKDAAVPDAGQDGSTWNLRNVNGAIAWAGGVGGGSGTDWVTTETASTIITGTGQFFDWDVTVDVQDFVDGTYPNYGWFLRGFSANASRKVFVSSDDASNPTLWPKLTITYTDPATDMVGTASGSGIAVANILGQIVIRGSAPGIASVTGLLVSNALFGSVNGLATVSATLVAQTHLIGTATGLATAIGDITADADLVGSASGTSTVTGLGSFEGQLRGTSSGLATVTGVGLALAMHVVRAQGCYNEPLLYITDGTIKDNGQLNRLDLINPIVGYMLNNWRPTIAQYKEGGTFSDSPHGTGRRLTKRVFGNAIEVFDLKAKSYSQDDLFEYTHELLGWQESAADYWTSDWADTPIYLVAKAARESNVRYAIIHVMSVPELENPYAQPIFGIKNSVLEQLTLRLERGDWTSNPPGIYECVAVSSIRSWTVAGWVTGS